MPTQEPFPNSVRVTTGSRLHLGLLSFGWKDRRNFGGVGLMVDRPGFEIAGTRAGDWESNGVHAEQAREIARRCAAHEPSLPRPCRIEVHRAPPRHAGLGSGTQLGMAVAAAMHALATGATCVDDPVKLAHWCDRGKRSAIGLYGFAYGGLIVELGKFPGEDISPLLVRLEVPTAWRFVVLRPSAPAGLSGLSEQQAFDQLPPVPLKTTRRLYDLAAREIVPAVRNADFEWFSTASTEYGRLAGSCYRGVQQGDYHPAVVELADDLRRQGVSQMFQSSWGPALVVPRPDLQSAAELQAACQAFPAMHVDVCRPLNQGAAIESVPATV